MKVTVATIRQVIRERIRQDRGRTKDGPFKWNEFVDLAAHGDEDGGRSLEDRIQTANWYARWRLRLLGKGAARAVFLLNPKSVLKIALDSGGLDQNRQEVQVSSSAPADVPIARVLKHADDMVWLVSELVRPVKDDDEFVELAGYDVDDLGGILEEMLADRKAGRKLNRREYDDAVWGAWRAVESGNLALIDVANLAHWGVTADRRLVLLDYGYTQDMYDALPGFMKR